MPKTQKTYTLGKIKTLVDLNGDVTNFDLTFSATSKTGGEFQAVVVDQTCLDNNPELQYEKAPGTISGTIVNDKGVYQNYFLVLRSETPMQVDVVLELKEISKKVEHFQNPVAPAPSLTPPQKQSSINWKTVLIFIVVVGGIALLVYYYYKSKKDVAAEPSGEEAPAAAAPAAPSPPKVAGSPVPSVKAVPSPVASVHHSSPAAPAAPLTVTTGKNNYGFGGRHANESLLARLNSLPMRN